LVGYDLRERFFWVPTALSTSGHSRPGWPAASPGMVRYAAESGSELSCRDATGMTLMTETVASPPVAKPVSRPRSRKPATVSASALALHLDCSRTYIGKLEAEGVIQRQGESFPLDQSRVAYLRYLRREQRRSMNWNATCAAANAPKSGAIPTSGAIWWRCAPPRSRRAIRDEGGSKT
jgi:hypothetical protein